MVYVCSPGSAACRQPPSIQQSSTYTNVSTPGQLCRHVHILDELLCFPQAEEARAGHASHQLQLWTIDHQGRLSIYLNRLLVVSLCKHLWLAVLTAVFLALDASLAFHHNFQPPPFIHPSTYHHSPFERSHVPPGQSPNHSHKHNRNSTRNSLELTAFVNMINMYPPS
jgi:hypothetical protein